MKIKQLAAFKRQLGFSDSQAAEHIGAAAGIYITADQWSSMEKGLFPLPESVIDVVARLLVWRVAALDAATKQIELLFRQHGKHQRVALIEYLSLADWMSLPTRDPLLWRPQCSVVKVLAKDRRVKLVKFDISDFSAWLAGRVDGEDMRSLWAAEAS